MLFYLLNNSFAYINGIRTFANYVIDVDKDAKEAVIPNNITRAIKTVDFTTLDKIVFGSVTTASGLSEHIFPKTVSLEREDYLSHMMIENVFTNKYIENFELDENNGQYCAKDGILYSKDGETLTLYPKDVAYYLYTHNDEFNLSYYDNLKKYLRRTAKSIALRYLRNPDESNFIDFVKSGLLSKAAIKELFETANKENKTTAAAYLLEIIGEKKQSVTFKL